jgi:hypothetical protein
LSFSLAELHRRGFDAFIFNWKELAFVDPAGITGAAVPPQSEAKTPAPARKRSAQSGSMAYLQNTVMDAKLVCSELMMIKVKPAQYLRPLPCLHEIFIATPARSREGDARMQKSDPHADGEAAAKLARLDASDPADASGACADPMDAAFPGVPPPQASTGIAGLEGSVPLAAHRCRCWRRLQAARIRRRHSHPRRHHRSLWRFRPRTRRARFCRKQLCMRLLRQRRLSDLRVQHNRHWGRRMLLAVVPQASSHKLQQTLIRLQETRYPHEMTA